MPKNRSKLLFSIFSILHSRKGFTLIELLVFAAIFAGMMIAFISILVTITSIQSRQASVIEVNQQSQFLLQQIEQLTERSSLIELPQDTATTTLRLRMPASAEDPTYLTLSNGVVYLQQGTSTENALTSNKVTVSSLTFTKRSNPPGHDSVSVSFLVAYNSPSAKQQFSETLSTAIARVSAATFDANVIPSSTATFDLGVTSKIWRSINNTIYFSGSNVGIGVTPTQLLQVGGSGAAGDLYIGNAGNGIILKSPGGTCVKLTYTNDGALATSSIACT